MYITSKIEIKREKNRRSKQKREYKKKLEVNLNFHYIISDIWRARRNELLLWSIFSRKKISFVCHHLMHNKFCLSRPLISFHFFCAVFIFCCVSFFRLRVRQFLFVSPHFFFACARVCDTRFVLVPLLWCVQSDNNSFGSVHTSSSCYTYEIYLIIINAELQSSLNRLIFRLDFFPSLSRYFFLFHSRTFSIHPNQSIMFNGSSWLNWWIVMHSLFFILPHIRWIISFFLAAWLTTVQFQWTIYWLEKSVVFFQFKLVGQAHLNLQFIVKNEQQN